jgi:hypothetical protein
MRNLLMRHNSSVEPRTSPTDESLQSAIIKSNRSKDAKKPPKSTKKNRKPSKEPGRRSGRKVRDCGVKGWTNNPTETGSALPGEWPWHVSLPELSFRGFRFN